MEEWYIENPQRWVQEQEALTQANIQFQVEEEAKAHGFMRLHLQITKESSLQNLPEKFLPLNLIAVFPKRYPFFRPEVYAPDISLPRHQNIVGKNLCLIPRSTEYWLPEMTLAEHLNSQLHKVLVQGEVTDISALMENSDEQAEPVSEYYPVIVDAPVIFDTEVFTPSLNNKEIDFLGTVSLGIPEGATLPSRIVVQEAFDINKRSLGKLSDKLQSIFPPRMMGCIYRLAQPPTNIEPDKQYIWLISKLREQGEKLYVPPQKVKLKAGFTVENVIGLTFPEEHSPGKLSWGWIFIIAFSRQKQQIIQKRSVPFQEKGAYYARTNRININELSFRIPSLKPLADKKVAIIGLGALGGPSAIEFARNGIGEIRLVDHDIVNAGTIVRWPLGVQYAGMRKTEALEKFINENYPFSVVRQFPFKIGGTEIDATSLPQEGYVYNDANLEEFLDGVSLIYDATAETGVNHFLAIEAKKRGIPYICVYGTPGVWGGAVIRTIPKVTEGCWMCLQYLQADGTIPLPATNRDGSIQAPGCGDISFTGSSFELNNIIAAGVRLTVSTLCRSDKGYPDLDSDVGILSLVNDVGTHIFPHWSEHKLEKHPNCPYCRTESA